jgi:hypothetical protein
LRATACPNRRLASTSRCLRSRASATWT